MNRLLDPHMPAIRDLCQQYKVSSLRAFGSVLRSDFRADSDIDLVVEFDDSSTANAFQRFFDFKEALEEALGHPVDLITAKSLANPYFIQELQETGLALYAA